MNLEAILRAVPRLTAAERQQLRRYLDQAPEKVPRLTPAEKTRRLNAALGAMGDGLSPAELDSMTAAMTGEYGEPSEEADSDPRD